MLSQPGEKAHFVKFVVIRWVFVEILSCDVVTSAGLPLLTVKKGFKIVFAPELARSVLEVCSKTQKTAFFSILGYFGIQNSEQMHVSV